MNHIRCVLDREQFNPLFTCSKYHKVPDMSLSTYFTRYPVLVITKHDAKCLSVSVSFGDYIGFIEEGQKM